MKCSEFHAVRDAYVDRELSPAETAQAEAHLADCAECRHEVDSLRHLLSSAATLPKEIAPERNLWPEIAAELTAVHREAHARRSRPAVLLQWLLPMATAAAIVFVASLSRQLPIAPAHGDHEWTVASLSGTPRLGRHAVRGEAALQVGQWLETDARSRAKLAANSVGEVKIEPNSRIRLTTAATTDHTLQLERGTMSAFIWAPPRIFFVDTPAARATDLGCAYTMSVADNGDGELHVTLGYVALDHDGREAIIPARAKCVTRRGFGPGTPFADEASAQLRAALTRFDFERDAATPALREILTLAGAEDTVTLWNLLARTEGSQRAEVFDALAHFHAPPQGVTREGVLSGDAAMRQAWGKELGIGVL